MTDSSCLANATLIRTHTKISPSQGPIFLSCSSRGLKILVSEIQLLRGQHGYLSPAVHAGRRTLNFLWLTYDDYLITTNMARMKVHVIFNEASDEEITVIITFLHADSTVIAKTFFFDFVGKDIGF